MATLRVLAEFNETLARVVIYLLTILLLVSLCIAASFGWLAYSSLSNVAAYREAAHSAQVASRQCHHQLIRADAKLESVNDLFKYARGGGN